MYYIEASTDDSLQDGLINNTLRHDPAGADFETLEAAHAALDDFCERKGFSISDFNVDKTEVAA